MKEEVRVIGVIPEEKVKGVLFLKDIK